MTPAELVQAARANGMPAMGLTDHWLLTGAIEFVSACKQSGILPVIGLEVDLLDGLVSLLATSMQGWSNLCRLSNTLTLRDDLEAPCSIEQLTSYSKDLIALTSHPIELTERTSAWK